MSHYREIAQNMLALTRPLDGTASLPLQYPCQEVNLLSAVCYTVYFGADPRERGHATQPTSMSLCAPNLKEEVRLLPDYTIYRLGATLPGAASAVLVSRGQSAVCCFTTVCYRR